MILGVVAAKHDSKRLPGKNRISVGGKPLFWHSVQPLLNATLVDDVCVATDSDEIREYAEARSVRVVWRPKNAARSDAPLLSVLRFALESSDEDYDFVASIMANCPGHAGGTVDEAIRMAQSQSLREVRSFNSEGAESGLLVLSRETVLERASISVYMGAITSNVNEIHVPEDLQWVA